MSEQTNIYIDGQALSVKPSSVQTSTEIIRNTERALDGTMCVDLVGEKAGLQIVWSLVTQAEYATLLSVFSRTNTLTVKTDGNLLGEGTEGKLCYVESIGGQPLFLEDKLFWQSVSVSLSEV